MNHIKATFQTINFSGVDAYHENTIAEQTIQTVASRARTTMIQVVIMWLDQANLGLYSLALDHTVYLCNNMSWKEHGLL